MAHKIIWSPSALAELNEISQYISIDSETYAASVIKKIVDAVDRVALFPLMGRQVPEAPSDRIREILIYNWRVIYRVDEYDVEIVRIIHGAQRWRG